MGDKLFIYRYRDKGTGVRSKRNVSLKWTFLSIIIFFIILALVPMFKRKKETKDQRVIYEVPGKNVLIKKVPLPETMTPGEPDATHGKAEKKSGKVSREERLDKLYGKGKSGSDRKETSTSTVVPSTSQFRHTSVRSSQQKETSSPVPAAEKVGKAAKGESTQYIVQVGAFRKEKNALELMARLRKKGYRVFLSPVKHGKLGLMYHVSLDPVSKRSDALLLKEKLSKEEGIQGAYIKKEKR